MLANRAALTVDIYADSFFRTIFGFKKVYPALTVFKIDSTPFLAKVTILFNNHISSSILGRYNFVFHNPLHSVAGYRTYIIYSALIMPTQ